MGAFLEAQRPNGKIIWLTRFWQTQRTVADDTGRVKESAYYYATVHKPTSDSVGFEEPEIKHE